jgi:hypothetical protein
LGGGAIVALGAELSRPGTPWTELALIGGAIAAGELLELRPPYREGLPISFAYMVVLACQATGEQAATVLMVALLATFLVRTDPTTVEGRLGLLAERFLAGMAAVLAFGLVRSAFEPVMSRSELLIALTLSATAPIAVAEIARMIRDRRLSLPMSGRTADVALITSATLMGVSDLGVGGQGGMGLWGPAVFTIPLMAAWYSYEHLEVIRSTYSQTIRALGAAPELGGLVREGHAERVADLSVAIATQLGFSRHELEQLETAALLHHLGQVCLDEPEDGRAPEAVAVAQAGAAVLRGTRLLAPSGDIIAAEMMPFREKISSRPSVMSGQILKVASAFDELCDGRTERAAGALEVMFSAPGYAYDSRVLAGLEVILDRRGLLDLSR